MAERRALIIAPLYDGKWLPYLTGSTAVVKRLTECLRTYGKYEVDTELTDRSVSRIAFRDKLSAFLDVDGAELLFYFYGHGCLSTLEGGMFATSDAQHGDEGIPMKSVSEAAGRSKANEVILILDCCHAGAAQPVDNTGIPHINYSGRVLLAGCAEHQKGWEAKNEDNQTYGAFSFYALEGLEGSASYGGDIVSANLLIDYIIGQFLSWKQRPVSYVLGGSQSRRFILTSGFIKDQRKLSSPEVNLESAKTRFIELPTDNIPQVESLPPTNMPYRDNPWFVGRTEELLWIAKTLKGDNPTISRSVAITGLGGVGKTQLAAAFVHRFGQFFQGGIFWLGMVDESTITAQIAACGAYMPEVRNEVDNFDHLLLEDQARIVVNLWQKPIPRLIVFDNCESPSLLKKWQPSTGGCRVLITSRYSDWDPTMGIEKLDLKPFKRTQSIEMLRKFRPDLTETDPDIDKIAEEVGDLPLALHIAGKTLEKVRYDLTPNEYLLQLQMPSIFQHLWLRPEDILPTNHERHVARTFAVSYEQLSSQEDIDRLAIMLLARASCFSPGEAIPRWLLLRSINSGEINTFRFQTSDAILRLVNLGLIEIGQDGSLLVHRLVAKFIQSIDPQVTSTAQQAIEVTVLEETSRINQTEKPGPLLIWQVHLRHVTEVARLRSDNIAANLCREFGYHLSFAGELKGALPYYKYSLNILQKICGESDPETLKSRNDLGSLLRVLGELKEAQLILEEATKIQQTIFGEKHRGTAASLYELGLLSKDTGKLDEARDYLRRALTIRKEIYGEKHLYTAAAIDTLGMLLRDMGQFTEARSNLEKALEIRIEALGNQEEESIAINLNHLGLLFQDMGEWELARSHLEKCLEIRSYLFGDRHHLTAESLDDLGVLLLNLREYDDSRVLLERALTIRKEALPESHPAIMKSLNNLGMLMRGMGNIQAAREHIENALKTGQKILSTQHPNLAMCMNNLGLVLQDMGEAELARINLTRALEIRQVALGDKHPDVAVSLNNLGMLVRDLGELEISRSYLERALEIRQAVFKEKHPEIATSMNNLGLLLQDLGEATVARRNLTLALEIRKISLGEKHPDVATSLNNLGMLLRDIGELGEARLNLNLALNIRIEIFSQDNLATAASHNNLGLLLHDMRETELARTNLTRALEIRQASLREKHPDIATSLNNLGMLLRDIGEMEKAKSYLIDALNIRIDSFGQDNLTTAASYNNLGLLLHDMGEIELARANLTYAFENRQKKYGEKHLDVSESLTNLGMLERSAGKLVIAESYLKRALDTRLAILGKEHPDVATSMNNLGLWLQDIGEFEDAHKHLTRALEVRQAILREKHPDIATSLNNVGMLLRDMGKGEEAEKYLTSALKLWTEIFGESHAIIGVCLNNLGLLQQDKGQMKAARTYWKRALEICIKTLGDTHSYTQTVSKNLSNLAVESVI